MTGLDAIAYRWDNRANPFVVREMRQAVRGRVIAGLYTLCLATMLLYFIVAAVHLLPGLGAGQAGAHMVSGLLVILAVSFSLVIPIVAGVRLHVERHTGQMELVVISGLRFRRIFWGKLLAALAVEALVVCAALPFALAATYFRGVDIPTVLLAAGWLVFISAICITLCLALACHTMGWVSIAMAGLFGLFMLAIGCAMGAGGAQAILAYGAGALFEELALGLFVCSGLVLMILLPVLLITGAEKVNHNRTRYHHPEDQGFFYADYYPGVDLRRGREATS